VVLFLGTTLLSAENNAERSPIHMAKKILDESWNGKRIELKVGEEIQIELQGIGATGYAWYFDKLDYNLFLLTSEGKKGKKSESGDLVGSPIQYTWVIKAIKTGSSVIAMSYYRIWEGKDEAVRRFEVAVELIP
jgi:predicted secreted protein